MNNGGGDLYALRTQRNLSTYRERPPQDAFHESPGMKTPYVAQKNAMQPVRIEIRDAYVRICARVHQQGLRTGARWRMLDTAS